MVQAQINSGGTFPNWRVGEDLPQEMNLKLAPKGIMQEIREMRELEVQGGGECIKQEEEHMQRPRGEKGTEHSTV